MVTKYNICPRVISLEKGRIKVDKKNDGKDYQVTKCTSKIEYINYQYFKSKIGVKKISVKILGEKYYMAVVRDTEWDDSLNVLRMKFVDGKNVEMVLRKFQTYVKGVCIVNEVLQRLLYYEIYWLDFAPRNIIIDENEKIIYIIDFEKGFLRNGSVYSYLACIWEEYAAFLLETDRIRIDFDYIINVELKQLLLNEENKKGKRVNSIVNMLNKIYGEEHVYYDVFKILLELERPVNKGNKNLFPILRYERVLNLFGYRIYSIYICFRIRRLKI